MMTPEDEIFEIFADAAEAPPEALSGGRLASAIQEERVQWLMSQRLARRKLHDFTGDPACGKTTVLIDLSAQITLGRGLDGELLTPGNVTVLSFEDDAEDTLRPRFRAAGADLDRVRSLDAAIKNDDGTVRPTTLPADIPWIEMWMRQDNSCLFWIDPIAAALSGSIDTYRDSSVRRVLAELQALAQRTNAAVAWVRHLNKQSGDEKALYRGNGSIAYVAAARIGYLVGQDPTDKAEEIDCRRVLACVKNNLAPTPASLAFKLRSESLDDPVRVEWLGGRCALTADDLLRPQHKARNPEALEEAKQFLRDHLRDGPRSSKEIEDTARSLGISSSTLRRARDVLEVKAFKESKFDGGWAMKLLDPQKSYNDVD